MSLLLLSEGEFSDTFSFVWCHLSDLCRFASAGAPSGWGDRLSGAAAAKSGPWALGPTTNHQEPGRVFSSQQLLQVPEQSVWWVKTTAFIWTVFMSNDAITPCSLRIYGLIVMITLIVRSSCFRTRVWVMFAFQLIYNLPDDNLSQSISALFQWNEMTRCLIVEVIQPSFYFYHSSYKPCS